MSEPEPSRQDNEDMRAKAHELLGSALPSSLGEAMSSMHEMFLSLRAGGFSQPQALWIIGYVISGGANPQKGWER